MKILLTSIAVILLIQIAHSKVFSRCELARELLNNGMARHELNDWVCLVESESSRNTGALGRLNADGSTDYGLFQINGRYWCGAGYRGGGCSMDCNSFLDDNIYDDVKCVKHIFTIHSWQGWYGWVRNCKGQHIPDIRSECGF